MNIKCPKCGKPSNLDASNQHRPFCSERCQILDLGAWADESYKVPVEEEKSSVNKKSDEESDTDDDLSTQTSLH